MNHSLVMVFALLLVLPLVAQSDEAMRLKAMASYLVTNGLPPNLRSN